jgi:hypothetical protein
MEPPASSFSATFKASTFDDSDTAFEAVRDYAKAHMFAIFVRSSKPSRCVWACSKAGKYDSRGKDEAIDASRQREGRSKKTSCQWAVECKRMAGIGWSVRTLNAEHNHPPVTCISALPEYRLEDILPEDIQEILALANAGSKPKDILSFLRQKDDDCLLTTKDISNITQKDRIQQLGGLRPIEWLLSVSRALLLKQVSSAYRIIYIGAR